IAGLPMIITFVEIDAPGTGRTVDVVQGLLAGDGGTGHVVGLALMSPAHSAGDPPTITLVCLGITTTGPMWQHWMTADALAMGGKWPFFALRLRVVSPQPCSPTTTPEGETLRTGHPYDLPPGARGLFGPPRRGGGRLGRRERARRVGASGAVRRR